MTGAQYFRATDTKSLEKIYEEINAMEATTRKIKHFDRYQELFAWLIFTALVLLGVELFLVQRRLP
jgi:Ca-activated chloride channel family protein